MVRPDKTQLADTLMEDDPGIYQDLLAERDEAMQRLEAAERSARDLHIAADQFARERDELRAENERWREVVKTFSVGNVALEAENERLNQQAIRLFDNIYALEAEVERLRQDGEEGARQFLRLSGENEQLRAELARWKSKACGRIFPIPVPGEAVEYCVRDYDHEGAHQAKTGTTW